MFTGYTATGEFIPNYESFVNITQCPTKYPVGSNYDFRSSNDHIKSIINFFKNNIPVQHGQTAPPCTKALQTRHIQVYVIEAFQAIKSYCLEIMNSQTMNPQTMNPQTMNPQTMNPQTMIPSQALNIIYNIREKLDDDIEKLNKFKFTPKKSNKLLSDVLTEMINCIDTDNFDNKYTINVNKFIKSINSNQVMTEIHIGLSYVVLLARALLYYYTYIITGKIDSNTKIPYSVSAYSELMDIVNIYNGNLNTGDRITSTSTCAPIRYD
jgi:hypothetical protein